MQNNFGVNHWNNIKIDIKNRYPSLTDSDLLWRDGNTKSDLVRELAARIGISWKELETIIDDM